jgi:hypothetical protein
MRTVFNGWRRKAGVITLVMACGVSALWVRSRVWNDCLSVRRIARNNFSVCTYDRGLGLWWDWWNDDEYHAQLDQWFSVPKQAIEWKTNKTPDGTTTPIFEPLKQKSWHGFLFYRMTVGEAEESGMQLIVVPYHLPSLTLSLLSAYLILWRPRKRV